MDTVLEIHNLCKNFNDFSLHNINMSLEKGTLTGFIGPNGAGKTTTIKSILNMIKPDNGEITVLGMDSVTNDLEIKSKLGIVLDDGHFYEDLTLNKMKNLIAPMYPAWNDSAYQSYRNKFELPGDKKIKDLSRGMRMKYALVLALSHGAELFILDEPTSGLDPLVRSELIEILRDLVLEDNKTVLMSTHITSDLDKIADYLYFIINGKIILQGQKDEIKERHTIIKGDTAALLPDYENYFVGINKSAYGFEGLTDHKAALKAVLPDQTAYEAPSIEDIMLYYKEVQIMRSNFLNFTKMQFSTLSQNVRLQLLCIALYPTFFHQININNDMANVVIYAMGLLMLSYLLLRSFAFDDAKYKTKLLFSILPVKPKEITGARYMIIYLFCLIATPLLVIFSGIAHAIKPEIFAIMQVHIIPYGLLLAVTFLPAEFLIFYMFEAQKADIIGVLMLFPYAGLMILMYNHLMNSPLWIIVFIIAVLTNVFCYRLSARLYENR